MLWWTALFTLLASSAQAQTVVSGSITSHQTWTAAQSPYLLQGDVVLDNNALLSIQPGVIVRMAQGASFTLKKGALQAVGTAAAPIVITSDAATPAPGDWRQWRFGPGTDDARTLLEHVVIEYGAGVAIESASPVLRHTELRHHSGPAVQMDLASSPIGAGNRAHGNALNAIAVPAGTIRGQVVWGLVGIPYLVQEGLVQVGQAPLSLEPARLRLSPGVVALLRASLAQPAGGAGVVLDVASSVPSVASTASRVTIGAGQSSGDIEVQAGALGSTRITLSHAQLGMTETLVEVVQLPPLSLAPGRPTLGVGRPYPMSLSLPSPAPAGGATVQLLNTDASVLAAPSSVVVPAGQRSAHFEVTGLADGQSRLSARAQGFADAMATLTVRGKALVLPASIVVAPGGSTEVLLHATEPAPAGGLQVSLSSSNTAAAQAPASTSIAAGQSSGQFTLQGVALGTAQLTASAAGYQSASGTVLVDAIAIQAEPSGDITTNEGLERTLRVLLSKAAPPGGIAIAASSSAAAVASVSPAELLVPEGQVYATQPLTIQALSAGQTDIALSAPGLVGKNVQVTVREGASLRLKLYRGSKVVAGKGMRSYHGGSDSDLSVQRIVNGSVSSGADAVTVKLRCVNAQVCTVPETVTIPAGYSQVAVPVTGVDVGSTHIEATAEGYTASTPVEMETVLPQVLFHSLDGNRTTSSVRDGFSISLRVPGAVWPDSASLVEAASIQLDLVEQTPAGVVNGIYSAATGGNLITQLTIAKGHRSSTTAYIAQPALAGSYRVQADVAGITSGQSAVQTVAAAEQALQLKPYRGSKVVAGKGMRSYHGGSDSDLSVQRIVNGSVSSGADAVTVKLRCVNAQVCTVPETVTIPAGYSQVAVPVTGVDVGSTHIEATAEGYTASTPAEMETVLPQVLFHSLDGNRTTSSVRDGFSISLRVPGAVWPDSASLVEAASIQLDLVEQTPAGVVNGIYSAATDGNLITQLTIAAGHRSSGSAYIAQPALAGSYRVQADVTGIASGQSAVQTVEAAQQALQLKPYRGSKVVAGKGMRSYHGGSDSDLSVQRIVNGSVSSGADAVTVKLRCVNAQVCTVPETVTIPAGYSQVAVPVTGVDVGSTHIEATAEGYTASTPVEMETVLPQVLFHSLDGNRTTSSVRDGFSISLRVPGAVWPDSASLVEAASIQLDLVEQTPAGVVNGIYSAATDGNLITQLTIAAGHRSSGSAYIAQPALAGSYRVQADVTGIASGQSAVQTVEAAQQALQLKPYRGSKVVVGKGMRSYHGGSDSDLSVQRIVNGSVSSGADAVTVRLRCVNAQVCTVPETVTIPAGQSQVAVPVTGVDVGSTQIEVTAVGFGPGVVTMETIAPRLIITNVPATLAAGASRHLYARAQVPGAVWPDSQTPAADLTLSWTSAVPSVGTVTASVSWNAGAGQSQAATFQGVAPGATTVTVSAPGFVPATSAAIQVTTP
ncbi:hypothetical protein ABFV80_001480 [Vandammella animalimorsus]|uniref:hypothetical protein n=1 Tax=Vandammella animalimorsus TaxID=2029117 RepID=UPI00325BD475